MHRDLLVGHSRNVFDFELEIVNSIGSIGKRRIQGVNTYTKLLIFTFEV